MIERFGIGSRLEAHPNLRFLDQHGTIYLVPLGQPALRLNHTASEIWRLLCDRQTPLGEVSGAYAERFACTLEQAELEVRAFTDQMCEAGFLVEAVANG